MNAGDGLSDDGGETDPLRRFVWVNSHLSRLLGVDPEGRRSPAAASLHSDLGGILARCLSLNHEDAEADLLRLQMLSKHLLEIEARDSAMLKGFRRQFHRLRSGADFHGWRMEVAVAASLIRKGASFTKSESPDFRVQHLGVTLGIEATSAHLGEPGPPDFLRKLHSCLGRKSSKSYANGSTALFVDVTNLYFHVNREGLEVDRDELRTAARSVASATGFGCALLFVFVFTEGPPTTYQSVRIRADGEGADPVLVSFLDAYYPLGEQRLDDCAFPSKP